MFLKYSFLGMVLAVFSTLLPAEPAFIGLGIRDNKLEGLVFTADSEGESRHFHSLSALDLPFDNTKVHMSENCRVASLATKKDQNTLTYKFWLTNDGESFCFCSEGFVLYSK